MITTTYGISVDSKGDFHLSLPHTVPRLPDRSIEVSTVTPIPVAHAMEILRLGVSQEANALLGNLFPYGKTIADRIRSTKKSTGTVLSK